MEKIGGMIDNIEVELKQEKDILYKEDLNSGRYNRL